MADEKNDATVDPQDETTTEETNEETNEETSEPSAREKELEAELGRLKRQLKKAERKEIKAEVEKEVASNESDGFGWAEKAYLKASGITEAEFDYVEGELGKFKGNLEELMSNNYFKAGLDEMRKAEKLEAATPKGSKRASSSARDSVEYWIGKGELPPNTPENMQLRREVVNKRVETEKNASKFSDTPIIK